MATLFRPELEIPHGTTVRRQHPQGLARRQAIQGLLGLEQGQGAAQVPGIHLGIHGEGLFHVKK